MAWAMIFLQIGQRRALRESLSSLSIGVTKDIHFLQTTFLGWPFMQS